MNGIPIQKRSTGVNTVTNRIVMIINAATNHARNVTGHGIKTMRVYGGVRFAIQTVSYWRKRHVNVTRIVICKHK